MLKLFFWLLLLANAVLFTYQRGYLENLLPNGREPARIAHQLNPDRIRLLPAPATATATETPAAVPQPGASVSPAPAVATPAVAPKTSAAACIEIGNFSADDAKRFSARLAGLASNVRISQRAVPENAPHIVYIPPQGSREEAEKKAGELRRLGIKDFFVIQDDSSLRWGISLGLFKQEDAARAHLASLIQKGVHSARLGERADLIAVQVRDLDVGTMSALDQIKADFPKQVVRGCEG